MNEELYKKILNVNKPEGQPFHHYALLDIKLFESDSNAIHKAGLNQIKKLKQWQLHPEPDIQTAVQDMLNRISLACTILEVPEKKTDYDKLLSEQLNIDLSQDASYQVQAEESNLLVCPNCRARLSKLSILCVECGYNFQTGQVLKTQIEQQNLDFTPYNAPPSPYKNRPFLFMLHLFLANLKLLIVPALIIIGAGGYFIAKHYFHPDSRYVFEGEFQREEDWRKLIKNNELWQVILQNQTHTPGIRLLIDETVEHGIRRTHLININILDNSNNELITKASFAYIKRSDFGKKLSSTLTTSAIPALVYMAGKNPALLQLYQRSIDRNNELTPIFMTVLSQTSIERKTLLKLIIDKLETQPSDEIVGSALQIAIKNRLDNATIRTIIKEMLAERESNVELDKLARTYYNTFILPGKSLSIIASVYSSNKKKHYKLPIKVSLTKSHKVAATLLLPGKTKTYSGTWHPLDNGNINISIPGYYKLGLKGTVKNDFSGMLGTGGITKRILPRGYYYQNRSNYRTYHVDWSGQFIKGKKQPAAKAEPVNQEVAPKPPIATKIAKTKKVDFQQKQRLQIQPEAENDINTLNNKIMDITESSIDLLSNNTDRPTQQELTNLNSSLTKLYRLSRKTKHDEQTQLLKANRYLVLAEINGIKKYDDELLHSYESLNAVKSGNITLTDKTMLLTKQKLYALYKKLVKPLYQKKKVVERQIRVIDKQLKSSLYSVKQLTVTTRRELNPLYKYHKKNSRSRKRGFKKLNSLTKKSSAPEKYITIYYVSINGAPKQKMSQQKLELYKSRNQKYKELLQKRKKYEAEQDSIQNKILQLKNKYSPIKS